MQECIQVCNQLYRSHVQLRFFQFFRRVGGEQEHDTLDKRVKERAIDEGTTFQPGKGSFDHWPVRANGEYTTPSGIQFDHRQQTVRLPQVTPRVALCLLARPPTRKYRLPIRNQTTNR